MKLTVMERLGNFVSGGAVMKYKLDAMMLEERVEFLESDRRSIKNSEDRWCGKALRRAEALRNILDMGTPNMAHIGKKMQAEALKGLGQQNSG